MLVMQKLQAINQKITDLQKQRDTLERRAAWTMFQAMKDAMGNDFDPHLCVAFFKDAWRTKTSSKIEGLKQETSPFRRDASSPSQAPKDLKTNSAL
ncbi:MAG: hypothetical protein C0514_08225 [Candidatus Puniceispirillum sp.]|nr:hypothetical protein [Candidatus Puniceispirillum sp.]